MRLSALWAAWKRLARRIGDAQARLILGVFYFVILAPFALAVRWGADPLAIKARTRGWQARRERREASRVWAGKQS